MPYINNLTLRPGLAAQIRVYESVETPLGLYFWDRDKLGLATIAALAAGVLGLFGGAYLGLQTESSLLASFAGMASSALCSVLGFFSTLRA